MASFFALHSQDKVYFTDGSLMNGKVLEVGSAVITVQADGEDKTLNKDYILMIEYKGGRIEKYNNPEKEAIYNEDNSEALKVAHKSNNEVFERNHISLNTLALCNSDISVFFERITATKKFGFGCMGAYNFNSSASVINSNIFLLNNPKKKYDLGVFANYYDGDLQKETVLYYGVMIKYMQVSFTSQNTDSVKVGTVYVTNTTFTHSTGSQLATIFTTGTHSQITKNFFLKTMAGLGGFMLRGVYKQQYNLISNSNVRVEDQYNRKFLFKLYFSISAGFTF